MNAIINEELKFFYQKMVVTSLVDDRCVQVDHEDPLLLRFCKKLERKRFCVTYEEGDFIYIRPEGLYFDDQGDVVICRYPGVHLPNYLLTEIYQ